METQLHYADPVIRISSSGPFLFAVWSDTPHMAQMHKLRDCGDAHRDSLAGGKQAFVNIVLDGPKPRFNDEVRAEAAHHSRRSSGWRAATAHVILMSGARAITLRAFMNTFLLIGRPAVPVRVFGDVPAAIRWIHPHVAGGPWDEAALLRTAEQVMESAA